LRLKSGAGVKDESLSVAKPTSTHAN
jgi:hypothetical protein